MNDWEKLNQTALPEKEELYSNLNMKDITDTDYIHAKRNFSYFKTKNLGEIIICILNVIHYFWLIFSKTSEKCF